MEVKSFWKACCGYWGRKSGHETEKDDTLTVSASACQISEMTADLKQEYNNTFGGVKVGIRKMIF